MKIKWGSCNYAFKTIRLNADLAKTPPECLEYIVVHEMAHLLVRHHNDQFGGLMDRCLPKWKLLRQMLNDAPLAHADWAYGTRPKNRSSLDLVNVTVQFRSSWKASTAGLSMKMQNAVIGVVAKRWRMISPNSPDEADWLTAFTTNLFGFRANNI
jgi:hypothetical protein